MTTTYRPSEWLSLANKLIEANPADAIQEIEQSIRNRLHHISLDMHLIQGIETCLYESNGNISIAEVADRCYLSLNQFERRFSRLTGISPKQFARRIRIEAVRDTILHNPLIPLTELAFSLGYTDQSHLTRDFRTFTPLTPGQFKQTIRARW